MSKLQLEVGKSYKNGEGETVKIISHYKGDYDGGYPFFGDNGEYYTPSGGFTVLGQTKKDLVEELETESKPDKKAPNRKELAGWFRKIADSLESDKYSEFIFHQGEMTIDQRQTYPESDSCSTEVSIDMAFDLKP